MQRLCTNMLCAVAAFMPAAWISSSLLALKSQQSSSGVHVHHGHVPDDMVVLHVLRTQVDRCQHCWQPLHDDDKERPVRFLQPCAHAVHVDCAHVRSRKRRIYRNTCSRCHAGANVADTFDNPLPLHVAGDTSTFWSHPSLRVAVVVYPVARRGVMWLLNHDENVANVADFGHQKETRGDFVTQRVMPLIRPYFRPIARITIAASITSASAPVDEGRRMRELHTMVPVKGRHVRSAGADELQRRHGSYYGHTWKVYENRRTGAAWLFINIKM